MEKGDGENLPDDGIVAEDLTQLVEHIELTSAHRLPDTQDWELVTPVGDLDDAPILIGTLPDEPGIAGMDVGDDTQLFIDTQADLARLLPEGERRAHQAAAQAAERARWQKRVDELERTLAERNQLLAERERRIEELQARLAARTLKRLLGSRDADLGHHRDLVIGALRQARAHDVRIEDRRLAHDVARLDPARLLDELD